MSTPDLFSYNVMIRASASRGDDDVDAIKLYKRMMSQGIRPDFISVPFVFKQCGYRKGFDLIGRSLHAQAIIFGVTPDVYISNTVITFYASHGFLIDARKVFDEMLYRDVVSWNSIIIGCLRCNGLDQALSLFYNMTCPKNIVTWNSIITGFVQGGRGKEALGLFNEMQTGGDAIRPDKITFANVITACGSVGAIDHGKWVHSYLKKSDLSCDYVIETALVDMYAGRFEDVKKSRNLMNERGIKKDIAGCSMIEVDGTVHEFSINGSPDVEMKMVIHVLNGLYCEFINTRIYTQGAAEK
ncbi:hypothetical protein QQ045_006679 [Rhodiola kirilowii]